MGCTMNSRADRDSEEVQKTSTTGKRSLIYRAMLMVALYWCSLYIYVPHTAIFLKDLSVGQGMIGLVAGAYGIGQIILRPPLGMIVDIKGRTKISLLIGVMTPAVASLIRILNPSGGGFFVANIVSSVGAAMWIVFIIFFAQFLGKGAIQQATALLMGANAFGRLIGFGCSTLFYHRFGMSFLCWLSVIAAAGATALALSFVLNKYSGKDASVEEVKGFSNGERSGGNLHSMSSQAELRPVKLKPRDFIPLFTNKRLLFFSFLSIMQAGVVNATVNNFDTQRVNEMSHNSNLVGLLTVFFIIIQMTASMVSSTYRFRRHGAKVWLPVCLAAISIYCFISPSLNSVAGLFLLQILSGFFAGAITSFSVQEGTKEIPEYMHTTAMGVIQSLIAVGLTLIPMLGGWIADRTGRFGPAYYAIGGVAVIFLILSIWGTRTEKLDTRNPFPNINGS